LLSAEAESVTADVLNAQDRAALGVLDLVRERIDNHTDIVFVGKAAFADFGSKLMADIHRAVAAVLRDDHSTGGCDRVEFVLAVLVVHRRGGGGSLDLSHRKALLRQHSATQTGDFCGNELHR